MAKVIWSGVSGDWSDSANWHGGVVPGPGDDVAFTAFGYYAVTDSAPINVASIELLSYYNGNLDLTGNGVTDTVSGNFYSRSSLYVDGDAGTGGTTLNVGGKLTNLGSITLGTQFGSPSAPITVTAAHFFNAGDVNLYGGFGPTGNVSLIDTGDVAPVNFQVGNYTLSGDALLEYASGSIEVIKQAAYVTLNGPNARIADAAHPDSNSALTGLKENDSSLTIENGASITGVKNSFWNGGFFNLTGGSEFTTVEGAGFSNHLDVDMGEASLLVVRGTLTNDGQIRISDYTNPFTSSRVVVDHLINNGSISLSNGDQNEFLPRPTILDVKDDAAPAALTGGLDLSGNSVVVFASGSITSIAQNGSLSLIGKQARVADAGDRGSHAALSGLASNAGFLTLSNGATLKNSAVAFDNSGTYMILSHTAVSTDAGVDFNNSGTLDVDTNGFQSSSFAGSSLYIGGTLTNSGVLNIQSGYDGVYSTQATVVTAKNLAEIGTININGYIDTTQSVLAEFIDKGDFAPGTLQAGVSLSLSGDALLQFAGGTITSIASGALLSLDGAQARIADSNLSTINSALETLSSNAGTLVLADGADLRNSAVAFDNSGTFSILRNTAVITNANVDFANSGNLNIDSFTAGLGQASGGSTLDIGGTLTNSGVLTVGTNNAGTGLENLTGSSVVVANHLVNTGTINLFGSVDSESQAWLNDSADAAPTTLEAGVSLNLIGDALLEFGSGHIKTIAAGAQITLDGADACIADAGHMNSNSVLAQLGSNAGVFTLADGAALTITGATFDNSGTFSLLRSEIFHVTQNFQNDGTFNVDFESAYHPEGDTGSQATIDGTLTNTGTINIGDGEAVFFGSNSVLNVAHLVNSGTINIEAYSDFSPTEAILNDTGDAAPDTLAAGVSLNLSGNALLEYASGGITSIGSGAQISLNGTQARIANASDTTTNSALTGLVSNAGTLTLTDATVADGESDFTNSGTLIQQGGGTLSLDSLTNSGSVAVSTYGVLNIAADVTNTGTVHVGDGTQFENATLSVTGAYMQNTGETDINVGMLSAQLGITVAGGVLDGRGQLNGNVDVTGGTFAGGMFTQTNTGYLLMHGNLTVEAGGTFGTTLIAPGNAAGSVGVAGSVTLNGGVLDLNVVNPDKLKVGETFTIMTFDQNQLTGAFSEVDAGSIKGDATGVDLGNGFALDVIYNNASGGMFVKVVATPTPAAHDLLTDNAHHGLMDDAILALAAHGLSLHHGDHALHFEHAPVYDNAPLI
jgi:fibronectin-binding autotransporter adhesin